MEQARPEKMTDRITNFKIYLLKSFLWWVLIAWLDLATLPATNKSSYWQGIWVALCLISIGAYSLSKTLPKRWVFIYGCGCSLSLMLRLHAVVSGWHFTPTSKPVVALWLIGLVFTLGLGCYFISLLHAAIHSQKTK